MSESSVLQNTGIASVWLQDTNENLIWVFYQQTDSKIRRAELDRTTSKWTVAEQPEIIRPRPGSPLAAAYTTINNRKGEVYLAYLDLDLVLRVWVMPINPADGQPYFQDLPAQVFPAWNSKLTFYQTLGQTSSLSVFWQQNDGWIYRMNPYQGGGNSPTRFFQALPGTNIKCISGGQDCSINLIYQAMDLTIKNHTIADISTTDYSAAKDYDVIKSPSPTAVAGVSWGGKGNDFRLYFVDSSSGTGYLTEICGNKDNKWAGGAKNMSQVLPTTSLSTVLCPPSNKGFEMYVFYQKVGNVISYRLFKAGWRNGVDIPA